MSGQQFNSDEACLIEDGIVQSQRRVLEPPTDHWRDGICDCCNNLWPSCYCAIACSGSWLMSQIAQKTKFTTFSGIMVPYITGSIVCFILSEYYNPLFGLIPPIAMLCTGIMLRLHVARLYNIKAGGPCVECMIGCCCCFCSLAQMSRHIAGYKKVFDGDADIIMKEYHDRP